MGGTIQGRISNASNQTIYYGVTSTTLKLNKKTTKTTVSAETGVSADATGPKVELKVGGQYVDSRDFSTQTFTSKIAVTPKGTETGGLTITLKQGLPYYLHVWYTIGDKVIFIVENLLIQSESDARRAIWYQNGIWQQKQLCKEPKAWRLDSTGAVRNYPPGFHCHVCGGDDKKCKKNCAEQKEYGGLC